MSSLFAKEIIAVLDLEQIGLTPQEAQILTQRLTTELISLDKYQVVERNNMDKILKEQKFQHSGCTDAECAVEIGQLLNSDYIVMGSVNKFGNTYAIDCRIINVELGEAIQSANFTHKGEIDELLTIGIANISKQLCGIATNNKANTENNSLKGHLLLTDEQYQAQYNKAIQAYKKSKYRSALDIMTNLLSVDKNHELADNCQYWIALCYLNLSRDAHAIKEFENLLQSYPLSEYYEKSQNYIKDLKKAN